MLKTRKAQILFFLGGWVAFTYLMFATMCLFYVLGEAFPRLEWMHGVKYLPDIRVWFRQTLWISAIAGASALIGLNIYQWIQKKKGGE